MKRPTLLSVFVAAALSCAAATPTYEEAYDPAQSRVTDRTPGGVTLDPHEKRGPWQEAVDLLRAKGMNAPDGMVPPHTLRVKHDYRYPNGRLYGMYLMSHDLTRKGRMVVREKVVVFTTQDCLVHEILVHEYLHALHSRLNHVNQSWRLWDPEVFVAYFYTNQRDTFPACPE